MADELELETDDGDAVSISSVKAGGPHGDPLVFVSIGQADSRHVATAALTPDEPRTWASRKLLRHALRHYWEITARRHPPLAAIRVPVKPRMRCRALEPADACRLAAAARARHDDAGLAVLFALYLGLRREEIAG